MMQESESIISIKLLGQLLLEAGYVTEVQLEKALAIAGKNFLLVGKVLVQSKACAEADVNNAVELQKICKLEGMTGPIAVRALLRVKTDSVSLQEALVRIGWNNKLADPDEILKYRQLVAAQPQSDGSACGRALEQMGDVYAKYKLSARAEQEYEQAVQAYLRSMPAAAKVLSLVLTKLSKQAIAEGRHGDAKRHLEMGQTYLVKSGNRESREFVKLSHVSAEYHISTNNLSAAEQHYLECFEMLEKNCQLTDEQMLENVRKYVEIMNKGNFATKSSLSGLWQELNPDSHAENAKLMEDLLKGARLINEENLNVCLQHSKETNVSIDRSIAELKFISEKQLQLVLNAHELVKEGEITPQLGIWLLIFAIRLELDLDKVLEMFNCQARVRQNPMLNELKVASDKLRELEQLLSPTDLQIAFAHIKLAQIHHTRQQLKEADQHYKRALEILFVNPKIPVDDLIVIFDDYSEVKLALNDAAEAIRISRMAMQERIGCYGAETLLHAKGIEKLASIYCASGDHTTAVGGFKRALGLQEKPGASKEHELIHCLERLAECLVHLGDNASAEQQFERCLQIAESSFGKNNETTRHIKKKLSSVCKALGKMDKVARYSGGTIDEMMMI